MYVSTTPTQGARFSGDTATASYWPISGTDTTPYTTRRNNNTGSFPVFTPVCDPCSLYGHPVIKKKKGYHCVRCRRTYSEKVFRNGFVRPPLTSVQLRQLVDEWLPLIKWCNPKIRTYFQQSVPRRLRNNGVIYKSCTFRVI